MGSSIPDTLKIYGVTTGNIRFSDYDTANVTGVVVPLDFFKDQTDFTFLGLDQDYNLSLGYTKKTQFVSEDCGPRYILADLNILGHNFQDDSIRLVSRTPSRNGGTHVEIFRCPHPDTLGVVFKQLLLNPTQTTQSSRAISAKLTKVSSNGTDIYTNRTLTTVYLPVNLSTIGEDVEATYTFNFADTYGFETPERTLKISYTTENVQRYRPCGVQTFVTDILPDTDGSTFDSVRLTLNADLEPLNALTDPVTTNLEVFRCPLTNIAQFAFREETGPTSTRADTLELNGITTDYNETVYYENAKASIIQIPLNLDANSTTITIDYKSEALTDLTFTLTYTRATRDYYRNACGDNQVVITGLTQTPAVTQLRAGTTSIQYPPVTNFNIVNADTD